MTQPTVAGGSKAAVYEGFGNRALLRSVHDQLPPGGAVLDVGCASGGLLAALEDHAGRRVGIEPDPVAATAARRHADEVHVGSVHDVEPGDRSFDVVVLGDVLEHVADPDGALRRAAGWVAPGGRLVLSVPNVAHWSIRLEVLRGRWEYRASGILDDTHLRFFTWHSAADLVTAAGLATVERRPVISGLGAHLGRRVPGRVEGVWRRVGHRRPNLLAYQQLIVAEVPS
jgi:SAM-dependent methyltransferase